MPPKSSLSSTPLLTEATGLALLDAIKQLISVLANFSQNVQTLPSSQPPSPLPSIDLLANSIARQICISRDVIEEKEKRAVVVGIEENANPEETMKNDEELLKKLVQFVDDEALTKAYQEGRIKHHRFPKEKPPKRRILKIELPDSKLRDTLLAGVKRKGRPPPFDGHHGSYIRRDLMKTELIEERRVKEEAKRRNLQEGALRWGVRDLSLHEFRYPYRALPQGYSNRQPPPAPLVDNNLNISVASSSVASPSVASPSVAFSSASFPPLQNTVPPSLPRPRPPPLRPA